MNQLVMTPTMVADELASSFNAAGERDYWRATVGGSRTYPTVVFNSRATMVQVTYSVTTGHFKVAFTRTACAFGDFTASIYRSLCQIMTALKAAGVAVVSPVDEGGTLRIEYDPAIKESTVHLSKLGEDWTKAEPVSFDE